jgi:hypothetical protein
VNLTVISVGMTIAFLLLIIFTNIAIWWFKGEHGTVPCREVVEQSLSPVGPVPYTTRRRIVEMAGNQSLAVVSVTGLIDVHIDGAIAVDVHSKCVPHSLVQNISFGSHNDASLLLVAVACHSPYAHSSSSQADISVVRTVAIPENNGGVRTPCWRELEIGLDAASQERIEIADTAHQCPIVGSPG